MRRAGLAGTARGRPMTTPGHAHPLARALPPFLLAGLCLTTLDATAKYLVRDHPLFLVVWARYAGQMLVVTPYAWHRAGPRFWHTRHLGLHLFRSALLLAATACFFAGLRYLPLAEGSSITFLAPMFMIMLSLPVLGERPMRAQWIACAAGFVGILIMLRPGSSILHPAVLLLIGTALFNALYQLLTRKLRNERAPTTLFYSAIVGAVGLTLALPWMTTGGMPAAVNIALFLALGLCAGLGHGLLTAAYLRAPATLLTPFTYLQVLWATAYGYVIFGQLPDGWSVVGMTVIVGSGVLLALTYRRRAARALTR